MAKKPLFQFTNLLRSVRRMAKGEELVLESGFSKLEKFAHFWVLVGKSFVRNRCPVRASALSYSTLLALIPMLAVAMSVTSSLLKKEGEDQIEQFIGKFVSGVMPPAEIETNAPPTSAIPGPNPLSAPNETNSPSLVFTSTTNVDLTVALTGATNASAASSSNVRVVTAQKKVAKEIHDFIQNTRSGTLGTLGMVVLVFVAISMLSRVEATFNDIWGVTQGRNWLVRIVLYWTTITLGPLLLIAALGLAGGPHLQTTRDLVSKAPFIGSLFFQLLPLFVVWLTFALLYVLVPNTKVNFSAALVGGIIGGTLWHLNNVFGFLYVSRVVTNSKIYGSLGLVPVFMAGLYFSWLILLFGAQVAYAYQNRAAYLQEKLVENVNQRGREFVALRLMICIAQRFQTGQQPVSVREMSAELGVPNRLIQQLLQILMNAKLVIEVSGTETAYAPARPLDAINCHHILYAMRAGQGQELATRDEPVRAELLGEFARIQEAERYAASAVTMLALVNRTQARQEIPVSTNHEADIQPAPVTLAPADAPANLVTQSEPRTDAALGEPVASVAPGVVAVVTPPAPKAKPVFEFAPPTAELTTDDDRSFPL